MYDGMKEVLVKELDAIREAGTYKHERVITSPQRAEITVQGGKEVLNFCANNYLGLCDNPELTKAAKAFLDERAFGMSSVRFICGTMDVHKELEKKIAEFLGTDDCILYAACFDANGGVFEPLLGKDDAIITDSLNHASIIDGIRLCKAKRYIYDHDDMASLEEKLKEADAEGVRLKMVATDGAFSMDGTIAQLDKICDLADKYHAVTMVDDCHSTGFMGKTGRGTHEYRGVMGRMDIITSTLGKALGGASGGFTAARQEIVDILRNRSRPYLFSNTLAPVIAATSLKVFEMLSSTTGLRDKLESNTVYFRTKMREAGFDVKEGLHPIVPIMLGEAKLAVGMANDLLKEGIYVIGFSYPVVAKGAARIRVPLSAAHEREHLDTAVAAFITVGKAHGVIK